MELRDLSEIAKLGRQGNADPYRTSSVRGEAILANGTWSSAAAVLDRFPAVEAKVKLRIGGPSEQVASGLEGLAQSQLASAQVTLRGQEQILSALSDLKEAAVVSAKVRLSEPSGVLAESLPGVAVVSSGVGLRGTAPAIMASLAQLPGARMDSARVLLSGQAPVVASEVRRLGAVASRVSAAVSLEGTAPTVAAAFAPLAKISVVSAAVHLRGTPSDVATAVVDLKPASAVVRSGEP